MTDLEMKKVCSKLVFSLDTRIEERTSLHCRNIFEQLRGRSDVLGQIITGDQSWVFKYDPPTMCQSMQWKRSDKPQHKKARMARSQQKLMLILFFGAQGVVMAEWVPHRKNVDAAFYIEMLWRLRICIR